MVLQPIAENPQVQSLTTALKNICRDYPAGGTVLRELLQNADDAGADCVRFVLDDRTHSVEKLIHPGLNQYHGPALLAYNSAQFAARDFDNMARLWDSEKINDGSTTGRFGRGFNSVYNWTDSPSIISGDRLWISDPHRAWSNKGGPMYNIIKNATDPELQNYLKAFEAVGQPLEGPFEGTIIRIPLRTEAQALQSKISNRAISILELFQVLQSFADDFADSGLLFMRSLEKLEIIFGEKLIKIEVADREIIPMHKLKVKTAVKSALENSEYSFDHSFRAKIEYSSLTASKKSIYAIHHRINGSVMKSDLRQWSLEQKFIPWAAVAAQVPIRPSETIESSLFNVLPLPIATTQPVHIHALFSVSPDRARLYHINDRSNQD